MDQGLVRTVHEICFYLNLDDCHSPSVHAKSRSDRAPTECQFCYSSGRAWPMSTELRQLHQRREARPMGNCVPALIIPSGVARVSYEPTDLSSRLAATPQH